MIVVDTSALIAIVSHEPRRDACARALGVAAAVAISAGTLYETQVVARRFGAGSDIETLLTEFDVSIHPLDAEAARRTAGAYDLWGKGIHRASLNLADCFAYSLARHLGCPLLYIGDDFARTDIASAI